MCVKNNSRNYTEAVLCFSAIINSANSKKPGNTVRESMASALKAGAADQGLPIRLYPTTGNTLLLQYSWKKTTGRQIMARNIKITPGKVKDHIPNDKNKKVIHTNENFDI